MEMNFPHDRSFQGARIPVSLRRLDMDILRALAFAPVIARGARAPAATGASARMAALMALFAGHGRAENVARGSFSPHAAAALARLGAREQQGENGVYQTASANRKAARLLLANADMNTNQAF